MMAETRKILGDERHRDLGHLRARARLQRALRVGQRADPRGPLARALPRDPGRPSPAWWSWTTRPPGRYPMPIDAAGHDEVFVGRIRRDPSHERCLNMWIVWRQPAQGRRHQRGAGRRAAGRAQPGRRQGQGIRRLTRALLARLRAAVAGRAGARGRARGSARHLCGGDAPGPGGPDVEVGLRPGAAARALRGVSRRGQDRRDRGAAVRGRVAARGQDLRVRRAAIGADGESPPSPAARITTPPSRAFEIGPYLQQLSATGAAVVWQTYEPATTALSVRARRAVRCRSCERDADADPPACRGAAAARARHRVRVPLGVRRQAGRRLALHDPAGRAGRLLLWRDRRLRHRHLRGAREPAPPVAGPAPGLRDHDRRQRPDLRHRGGVPPLRARARCGT